MTRAGSRDTPRGMVHPAAPDAPPPPPDEAPRPGEPPPAAADPGDGFTSMLTGCPAGLREALDAARRDPARALWAHTAAAAIRLATSAGYAPRELHASGAVLCEDARGEPLVLSVLACPADPHPSGPPGDVDRLTAALDATFGDREYVLYLRRAVPAQFDPAPIARAVQLWLGAIQRGEWQGQHAIYEDGAIALELTLTGRTAPVGRARRLFTVGPVSALERLAAIDQRLVEDSNRLLDDFGDVPVVFAVGSDGPWRMPRGYIQQLLYGMPWQVRTERGETSAYQAVFQRNERSLFSDPACRSVVALWWIAPGRDGAIDAGTAYDNPWAPTAAPAVPVHRFAQVGVERDAKDVALPVLCWQGAPA